MNKTFPTKLPKLLMILFLGLVTPTAFGQLIISQVYNGINNNKCIEIANISGDDINFASPIQYKIGLWATPGSAGNGSISGNPTAFINLTGTLPANYKCVISNTNSTVGIYPFGGVLDIRDNIVTTFDGNDALAIFTGTNTLFDSFGTGINYNATSYERDEFVVTPRPTFISAQWIPKTIAQVDVAVGQDNTILGNHYFEGWTIVAMPTLPSLSTTYGTPSAVNSLAIQCIPFRYPRNLSPPGLSPLFATIPVGFEASKVANFSSTIYAGGTTFEVYNGDGSTTIYLRLSATAPPGNYSGSVYLNQQNVLEAINVFTDPINTVGAKQITISGLVANNKVNDGTTTATLRGNAVLSGVFAADFSNVVLEGTPTANFNDALTGNNKPVTVTGYTISGSRAGYYLLNQPALTANITDVAVSLTAQTITFNALSNATYGGANFNLTSTASSGLAVSYTSSNPNVAIIIGNTVTIIGIGTTTITASQYGDSVYGVAPAQNQPLTVNPKPITVTATVAGKIYDRTNTATISGTLVGVINSDVVTFIGSGTFVSSNAGTAVAVTSTSTLSGANASNYILTQPTGLTANISARPLTFTGSVANKVYDRLSAATVTGTLSGVLSPDVVNLVGSGFFNSVNVGTVNVTSTSTLSGANAGNYTLNQPIGLSAVISKKAITLTGVVAANKVFDGTTAATITGTFSGVISPDAVNLVGTGTFASSAVGTGIAVTSTATLSGAAAGNYSLTQPTGLTANIIPAPTVLAVGDLSIIGFQFTTSNIFAFVAWVDINPNTYIKFTDNGFLSTGSATATNNARGGENFVMWRNTTGQVIPAGTVITIRDNSGSGATSTGSIVSGNLNGLSVSGDTIFAYQGTATSGVNPDWSANTNPTTFNGTILFGLYGQGSSATTTWLSTGTVTTNNSYLPSQLNVANGNIALASLASRGQYTGSRSNQTSFSAYRALVTNPANWTTAAGAGTLTMNTTGFALPPASTAAVISGTTSICAGNTANLKVVVTGGTAPYKIVYSDGTVSFTVNNYASNTNIAVSPSTSRTYSLVSVTDSNNLVGSGNTGTAMITVGALTTAGSESQNICGTSYTWPTSGATYTASGVYTKIVGCNTATLTLTLNTNFQTFYADNDHDGFGAGAGILSCVGQPLNTSINNIDCNDATALQNPNASEILANGIDDNCDGTTDEVVPTSYLIASSCGATLTNLSNTLFAYQAAAFQGYRFRVTNGAVVRTLDTSTNSFALTSLPGGAAYATTYTVEVSVKSGGYYRSYGSACTVSTPAIPNATSITNPSCGSTLTDMSNTIFCTQVPSASQYRFRVRLGTTAIGFFDTTVNRFSLSMLAGIQYGTTYTVDVLLAFSGVYRPNNEYGPACFITTPATPGTSRVIQPTCGSSISSFWTTIFAQQVPGAQGYKFVVTDGAQTREYVIPNPRFAIRNLGTVLPSTTYTIRVDVLYNASYIQGTVLCTLTTTAGATRQTSTALDIYEVKAYPNPYADTFKLDMNTSGEEEVGVKVYDMLGREVESRQASVANIVDMEIGTQYPSGVYNVIVMQGSHVKSLRIIKR